MAQAVFDLCVFDEVAFDESVVVPTAITQAASNIGGTTARINGKISDDGGASCEARFRWRKTKTLYEYYDTGDTGGTNVGGVFWKAQTFTPSVAHQVTSVKIKIYRSGSPGTLTVSIKATDGEGKPTGNDLCSGTTDSDTLPTGPPYEWREITFGSGYALPASTTFAIVVRALQGGSGNDVYWRIDASDPTYSGGYYAYSSNSGSIWTIGLDEDLMFEEWGEEEWATTEWQNTLETNDEYHEDLIELVPNTEYEFQTQAKNSAGEGAWSVSAYFTPIIILSVVDSILVGDSRLRSMVAGLSIIDGLKSGDTTGLPGLLNMLDGLKLSDSPSLLASLLASDGVKIGEDEAGEEATEEQTAFNYGASLRADSTIRRGQLLTIANRTVTKLSFVLEKYGSPTGDVTFTIRRVSDDGIITSKVWGDANALPETQDWREVIFDSPVTINEEVRILVEFNGGDSSNYIRQHYYDSDVKADELRTYYVTSYINSSTSDTAYIYTYQVPGVSTPIAEMIASLLSSDGLKLGDSNLLNFFLFLLVTDGVKLGDSLSILARLIISDGLELGDSPSMEMLADLLRSDGVELGDAATLGEAILYLAIVEGIKAGDTSLIGMLADIQASDGTKLGDATIQSLLASLGIEDGLKLGDTELADLADGILLSIIEGIKIGDSTSLENLIALAILEAIKVGDTGVLGGILGRILKLVIVTTQKRKVNVITCQKRKVRSITTQKRKVRVITGA